MLRRESQLERGVLKDPQHTAAATSSEEEFISSELIAERIRHPYIVSTNGGPCCILSHERLALLIATRWCELAARRIRERRCLSTPQDCDGVRRRVPLPLIHDLSTDTALLARLLPERTPS